MTDVPVAAQGTQGGRKFTVQIIEDEPSLREALEKRLIQEGFTIVSSEDGTKGLNQALVRQPDLILLDIKMPNMSGFEMLKTLREKSNWGASVPVVFLTNIEPSSDEEVHDIQSLHPTDYIVKGTTDLEEIAAMVKKVLSA